jgi:hypothetical protein
MDTGDSNNRHYLRKHYAGLVVGGLCSDLSPRKPLHDEDIDKLVELAFRISDKMVAEALNY